MEINKKPKGSSFATIATLFLFLATIGVTVFYSLEEYTNKNKQEYLEGRLKKKMSTMSEQSGGLEFTEFLNIYQSLDEAKKYRILWSQITTFIFAFENSNIVFENFSSTDEQQISIKGTAQTMKDIRGLITHLKKNKKQIEDPFINSLNKELTAEGQTVYNFDLNFNFIAS